MVDLQRGQNALSTLHRSGKYGAKWPTETCLTERNERVTFCIGLRLEIRPSSASSRPTEKLYDCCTWRVCSRITPERHN